MTTLSSARSSVDADEQLPTADESREVAMQFARAGAAVMLTVAMLGHVLGWTVAKGPALFDEPLLYWLQEHRTEHLNHAVLHLSALGTRTVLTPTVLLIAVALWLADRRRSALQVAIAGAGAGLMDWAVKWYVGRPRPFQWGSSLMIEPVDTAVQDVSFPSGHAMATMAIFLTLGFVFARMAPNRACRLFLIGAGVAMSLGVGACRPYLGVHYPTDVLTGWAAGAAWALAGVWILFPAASGAGLDAAASATPAPAAPPGSPLPSLWGRVGEGGPGAAPAAPGNQGADAPRSTAPAETMEAWFAPADDCVRRIVDLFGKARETADVCVFTITDDRISDALLTAHRRGVAIRVVSDDDKSGDLGSDIGRFRAAGIPVRLDNSPTHMHHKFAVFDGKLVMTGSFNWTRSAATQNQENFIVSSDGRLIEAYSREFAKLWRQFG